MMLLLSLSWPQLAKEFSKTLRMVFVGCFSAALHYWSSLRKVRAVDKQRYQRALADAAATARKDGVRQRHSDAAASVDLTTNDSPPASPSHDPTVAETMLSAPDSPGTSRLESPPLHSSLQIDELDDIDEDTELPRFSTQTPVHVPSTSATARSDTEPRIAYISDLNIRIKGVKDDMRDETASRERVDALEKRVFEAECHLRQLARPLQARRSVINHLLAVWRCPICATIKPPKQLVVAPCCREIVGCDDCLAHPLRVGRAKCLCCKQVVEDSGDSTTRITNLPASLDKAVSRLAEHDGEFTAF